VVPYERLKVLVIAHEEGRHELARAPPVNICCGHRGACPEILGNVLDTEVLLNVLLPRLVGPVAWWGPWRGEWARDSWRAAR
jgi:hypothetical protein